MIESQKGVLFGQTEPDHHTVIAGGLTIMATKTVWLYVILAKIGVLYTVHGHIPPYAKEVSRDT